MKFVTLFLGAVLALVSNRPAHATLLYGSLGNFDCINDTGSTAHGFEIELDGVLPSDVSYTFGAPYNRYGTPTITTDGVHTFVRYASTYNGGTWAAGTPSGTLAPTGGHSLFLGGDPNYPNVPGDHFGIGLNVTPTNTVYRWLLDPNNNGSLVAAGTQVKLPAPILTPAQPANPGNIGVQAVVQAPAPENGLGFGEAIWAKVFITVVENADPVKLEDLVLGNPAVPPETETEVEWQLLQAVAGRPDLAEKVDQSDLGNAFVSITRRYEFYKYTGGYDPENHEALFDSYDPQYVGDYLGNQNVALNFAQGAPVPEPSTFVLGMLGALSMWYASYRCKLKA